MLRKPFFLLVFSSLLFFGCSDSEPSTDHFPKEKPTKDNFSVVKNPSWIDIRLNKLVYENGDAIKLTLDFHGNTPPKEIREIFLSSSQSGDVETIEVEEYEKGKYRSLSKVTISDDMNRTVEPKDGVLNLASGDQFYALYFPNKEEIEGIEEDLIHDFAFMAGKAESSPVFVDSTLAISEDENGKAGTKAVGTLVNKHGFVQVATEEIIFYPKDDANLEDFLELSGGEILDEQKDEGKNTLYLVKIDTKKMNPQALSLLRDFNEDEGELHASKQEALDIYQFVLHWRLEGFSLSVNPRLQNQSSPRISATESTNRGLSTQMGGRKNGINPVVGCVPNDPINPCVLSVPAVWAFNELWDVDRVIKVAILDMGFASNDDFRAPTEGATLECDMTSSPVRCGANKAQGPPTVGGSFVGGKSWHGTGVASVIGAKVNDGYGVAGVAGQVVEPMLYKYDSNSYAFEIGKGFNLAVRHGASCINISAGYPCRVITVVGPYDICNVAGRYGICSVISAGAFAAAATVCAATAWIPIGGAIACGIANGKAAEASAACLATLFHGDLRSPMLRGVENATANGVPIVSVAGNNIFDMLPTGVKELVDEREIRTEAWQIIPSVLPNVITVGAITPHQYTSNRGVVFNALDNEHFVGDRVDIWAPTHTPYAAPESIDDINSNVIIYGITNGTLALSATSAAAPYITGLVANMQAINPNLDPHSPGMTAERRAEIVPRIRSILLDEANNFTNADLVELGYTDQPERRLVVRPIKVVEAAGREVLPNLGAYNLYYNFDERAQPNDTAENAVEIIFNQPQHGTILNFNPVENMSPLPDEDWYKFTMPTQTDRLFKVPIYVRSPIDPGGDQIRVKNSLQVPRSSATPYAYALSNTEVKFAVIGETPTSDNVYSLTSGPPEAVEPKVEIQNPYQNQRLCAGEDVQFFSIGGYDEAPQHRILRDHFIWKTPNGNLVGGGRFFGRRFSIGRYHINLSVFGTTKQVSFEVIDCIGNAPKGRIISPRNDVLTQSDKFAFTGTDPNNGKYYTQIHLKASFTDVEDGALNGAALVWTTDQTSVQNAVLGQGKELDVNLYSDTSEKLHTITLTATDSDGNVTIKVRRILIWTLL